MIAFGLRLALRGGKEAATRLAVTAAAVALGVGLLLVTLAAVNAVHAQNARYAWLNSGVPGATTPDAAVSPDPLWGAISTDVHDGNDITRVQVAATGPRSPVPPGIPRLPGPGQFYASPALDELLRAVPAAQLADRYPGRQIGLIGTAALPSPNSLIMIVGHTPEELSQVPRAAQVASIATRSPDECDDCYYGIPADGVDLILSVTAAALLFPVLIFIGTATRLTAARREQRFAAMRLIGATPGQVSLVAAVESTVAAVAGTVFGFALFFLLRLPLAAVPLTGETFFPGDLTLRLLDVLVVAIGIPAGAAVTARLALRRVRISPLGVSRQVTPRPPRAYRLIPLAAGTAELAYFVGRQPDTTDGQVRAYLSGILLMMIGLVVAGPWLTMVGARALARRTNRPATLIAGRRLSDNPHAGFRAVSGLVLALFVASAAVGVMTTMIAERGVATAEPAAVNTVKVDFGYNPTQSGVPSESVPAIAGPVLARLRSIAGVQGVTVIHTNPLDGTVDREIPQLRTGLVSCAEFVDVPGFGRCAPGAQVVELPTDVALADASTATTVWPTAVITAERLHRLPVQGLLVATNGAQPVIEQTRTVLAAAFPYRLSPDTVAEDRADSGVARQLAGFQQLATVVMLVSLCIAGCSLAVSVVGGLNDRKRPFSLLRLTGVQLGMLRRVIVLESAVPLLATAAVAIGAGFLAAQMFLSSQLQYSLHPPGPQYYLAVAVGLAASLGVIGATLPLLERMSGPEAARNE